MQICSHGISRRGFGAMALAGTAIGLLPFAAGAATELDALALMCIDYRLVNNGVGFFNRHPGVKKYDLVALAGASLAAASPSMFKPTVEGFWQQVGAAWKLHKIRKIMVVDHMGCGAFAEEFNNGDKLDPKREYELHVKVMHDMADAAPKRLADMGVPKLGLEFYLLSDPARGPVGRPRPITI